MEFSPVGEIADADSATPPVLSEIEQPPTEPIPRTIRNHSEAPAASGRGERHLKDLPYLFAFGCLGAFVLTAAEGMGRLTGTPRLLASLFPILVMSTAAAQAWAQANRHKDRNLLESTAEDLYLMGYVFTLCSFLGLLTVSDGIGGIRMGPAAAKLLTSVVGLAFLVLARNHARSWPEKPHSSGALNEAEIEFATTLESVKSWAAELNLGLQSATQWLHSSETQEFIDGGRRLGAAVHAAAVEISNGNRVLVDAIRTTAQAAKGLETCSTQVLAARQQTEETSARLSENAEKVEILTDSTAASLESTQRKALLLQEAFETNRAEVVRLADTLGFTQGTAEDIAGAAEGIKTCAENVFKLSEKLDALIAQGTHPISRDKKRPKWIKTIIQSFA